MVTEIVNDESILASSKLSELIRLAEGCVDLVQENNDHFSEVNIHYDYFTHVKF